MPITRNWLSEDHWLVDAYRGTGGIEIDKGVQLKDNPDIFEKVLTQLQKQYIENFSGHREKCHSTITQILMVFTRQRDMGVFYNVYGMPIMKTVMLEESFSLMFPGFDQNLNEKRKITNVKHDTALMCSLYNNERYKLSFF